MKNITLSIPDDLLIKSREYAAKHGTSLNKFIRDFLKQVVQTEDKSTIKKLLDKSDAYAIETKPYKWNRDEIYDRKVFH